MLRIGVALLGMRITLEQIAALGWKPVALVVILVVFHILRKKGVIGHRRKGRHSGRHGAVAERIQPVKEWGAESENEDYVNPDTASTQDSESVQETSSEGSDA